MNNKSKKWYISCIVLVLFFGISLLINFGVSLATISVWRSLDIFLIILQLLLGSSSILVGIKCCYHLTNKRNNEGDKVNE